MLCHSNRGRSNGGSERRETAEITALAEDPPTEGPSLSNFAPVEPPTLSEVPGRRVPEYRTHHNSFCGVAGLRGSGVTG
jgi:hypothetical protein